MKDRKFVQIRPRQLRRRDGLAPAEAGSCPWTTAPGSAAASCPCRSRSGGLEDFHPRRVLDQIAPLKKLLEQRQRLVDLLAKLDGNER
jgi:type VI secretion system protein ImpB